MTIFGVTLSPADRYLLGICGVAIMALIYPRLNDWQHKRGKLRDAVYKFKTTFSTEVAAISNKTCALDTFSSSFQNHESAVNTIRPVLTKRHRRKLQRAWDAYCGKDTDLGFDAQEYVEATSATIHCVDKALFNDFINRFNTLYSCLDDLL